MDNKEFMNNKVIFCSVTNKDELANFLNDLNIVTDTESLPVHIKAENFVHGHYYGLQSNDFGSFTVDYAQREADAERLILYNLDSIKYEYNNNIFRVPIKASSINKNSIRESGDISESSDNIISVNSPRSFPRVMWVTMNPDNPDSYSKAMVIAYARSKYIVWSDYGDMNTLSDTDTYQTDYFTHALELEDFTVLTKEDIAKLANTTVDRLKIIK